MNLALGLPRLPRAARRALASREALHGWWLAIQGANSSEALARFFVARVSEWLPLQAWALVVPASTGLTILQGPVLASGRRELLTVLREQAISRTTHRFGHLTRRP